MGTNQADRLLQLPWGGGGSRPAVHPACEGCHPSAQSTCPQGLCPSPVTQEKPLLPFPTVKPVLKQETTKCRTVCVLAFLFYIKNTPTRVPVALNQQAPSGAAPYSTQVTCATAPASLLGELGTLKCPALITLSCPLHSPSNKWSCMAPDGGIPRLGHFRLSAAGWPCPSTLAASVTHQDLRPPHPLHSLHTRGKG